MSLKRSKTRGAVMVEYAFLLLAIGLPTAAGMVAGGKSMFSQYKTGRNQILRSSTDK
jgi:hypothetical protein